VVLNPGLEERILAHGPTPWQQGECNIFCQFRTVALHRYIPLGPFNTTAMFKRLMESTVTDFIYEACLMYLMMRSLSAGHSMRSSIT
jgi:hypothetical protein